MKTTFSLIVVALLLIAYQPVSAQTISPNAGVRSEKSARFFVSERPAREHRDARQYSNGEIIVKLKNAERPMRVSNVSNVPIEALVARYDRMDDVEYAEPNYIAYALDTPNDPYYKYQWNFDNDEYGGVHVSDAWNVTDGSGVTVAIIDTGVAYENYGNWWRGRYYQAPDLKGTDFVQGYDFVNNDTHPNDDAGHGTHVAGTIAQTTDNNEGVAGIAHGASIMPLKVLDQNGSGTYADVVDAIRYAADHGANVINLSLGGPQSSNALKDALEYAYNKGVTIVAAAGNDGQSSVLYPAAYDDYVIAVGATRYDETLASYSNHGASLDIVAPGGDTSVDQNGDGYGDGILQQTFSGNLSSFGYYFYNGTSMAAPHVAAAAALVRAAGIASTPHDIRTVLEGTADDLGASGRDNTYGHGLLNLAAALDASTPVPEPLPDPTPEPTPEPQDDPPVVNITAPDGGSTVSDAVDFAADASDDNGIDSVDFYIDDVLSATDTNAPYGMSWNSTGVSNGAHTLRAVATDSIGQTATDSVSVTVENMVEPAPEPDPEPNPDSNRIVVFSDDFENDLTKWSRERRSNWDTSVLHHTDGRYSANVSGRSFDDGLTSQSIDLEGKDSVTIAFSWYIERWLDSGEYIAFDVSTDGGSSWSELGSLQADTDAKETWHNESFEVHNLNGQLRLRFRGTMNRGNEDAYLDGLTVTAY